jgi:peptidoglycan hydrolase-like protein with peptidoglycan-binding domain
MSLRLTRGRPVAVASLTVGLVAATIFVLGGHSGRRSTATSALKAEDTTTAIITRRDLAVSETTSGTLGYGASQTLRSLLAGAITHLPEEGSTVPVGATLYSVANTPVVLMRGTAPATRELGEGVSDGADVRQLEQNLRALGYDPYHQMRVDGHFDFATRAIVARWQRQHGLTPTGTIEAGRIVFAPGEVRVGKVLATVGAQGGPVMEVSPNEPVVTVHLDVSLQQVVDVGDPVTIDLPDGTTVAAKITEVGRVAQSDSSASSGAYVVVYARIVHPQEVGRLDQAPVSVHIEKERRRRVLVVPVTALVARNGGYAVEVISEAGIHRFARVVTGTFASGNVEITGTGIHAGMTVVVPSL